MQHLQALHAAGMVTRAREGTSVRYAIAGEEALSLWLALRDASVRQLAEVERAARDYLGDEVDAISRDELVQRLRKGDVVVIDMRPAEEYEAGHIDGARSLPIEELEGRLAELPADREIVAYCRGPSARTRTSRSPRWRRRVTARDGCRTAGRNGTAPGRRPSDVAPRDQRRGPDPG